jgi:hypothetical protein
MLKKLILALALFATPAFAQQPPAPPPDPNATITLTLGELQMVIDAQIAASMAEAAKQKAAGAFQKIQTQLAPKKDAP